MDNQYDYPQKTETREFHSLGSGADRDRPAGILNNMVQALAILEGELNNQCQSLTVHTSRILGHRNDSRASKRAEKDQLECDEGDVGRIASKIDSINEIVSDIAVEINRLAGL